MCGRRLDIRFPNIRVSACGVVPVVFRKLLEKDAPMLLMDNFLDSRCRIMVVEMAKKILWLNALGPGDVV